MDAKGKIGILLTGDASSLQAALGMAKTGFSGLLGTGLSMAKAFSGVGLVLGALGSAAGLSNLAKESADSMASIGGMAMRLGESTERMSGLAYAASKSGVAIDQLGEAFNKQNHFLVAAKSGNMEAAGAVRALGLNVQEFLSLSPSEQLESMSAALAKIPNEAQKGDIVRQVYGEGATGMVGLLKKGKAGIEELIAANAKLGNSFSKTDFAEIKGAKDSMFQLKTAISGVGNYLAITMAPTIRMISSWLTEAISWLRAKLPELKYLIPDIFVTVKYHFLSLWSQTQLFFTNLFTNIILLPKNLGTIFTWMKSNWKAVFDNWGFVVLDVGTFIGKTLINVIMLPLQTAADKITLLWEGVKTGNLDMLKKAADPLDTFKDTIKAVGEDWKTMQRELRNDTGIVLPHLDTVSLLEGMDEESDRLWKNYMNDLAKNRKVPDLAANAGTGLGEIINTKAKAAQETGPALALDRGSIDAFKAENKTVGAIEKLNNTAKQQLEQQKKVGDFVDKLGIQQGSIEVLGAFA